MCAGVALAVSNTDNDPAQEKRDPKLPPDAPVDEIWRIPAAGVLEFDYVCRSPEHVSTDRCELPPLPVVGCWLGPLGSGARADRYDLLPPLPPSPQTAWT